MTENKDIWEVQYIKEYADKLQKVVRDKEREVIKLKEDLSGSKIISLKKYEISSLYNSFVDKFKNKWSNKYDLDAAQKYLDEIYEKDKFIKEDNKLAIINNTKVYERTYTILKSLGLPDKEYVLKSPRSSHKTEQTAGWLTSISSAIPKNDYVNLESSYKDKCEVINKLKKQQEQEESQKQKLLEQEESKKKELKLLVSLGIKYSQEFDRIDDAVSYILSQDRYLCLAYYLEKNRGDWNDGASYAEQGLDKFTIIEPIDQAIYDEIQGHIEDWRGDGRIFRDCSYNYSTLYGMANQDLYKDLCDLKQYDNEWEGREMPISRIEEC
jgi:hypothetical protein